MRIKITKKQLKILLFLTPILLFTFGISYLGTDAIIDYVWVSNSYLFMFIIAFIGWVSLFSWVPYSLILITFALGWLDTLYLALVTCAGVMLWDCTSYFVGGKAQWVFTGKMKEVFDVLLSVYDTNPKYLIPIFLVYWAVSPFPNDMITLSSGMKWYSFYKTMIPLTIGNFFYCYMLAYFADFFSAYF